MTLSNLTTDLITYAHVTQGTFNNYVDKKIEIGASPLVGGSRDKGWIVCKMSFFVHIVFECPPSVCMSSYSCYMHVLLHLILDQRNDFKVGGTQKMSKYCHIIAAGPLGSGRVHCGLAGVSCGVHWEFVGGPFGSVKFIYCEKTKIL